MSARVLNPMLMTEMGRSSAGGLQQGRGRVVPTKAELAPIRRDLFGPIDHAAARALAERELQAQSRLDAERWGFDFQSGVPRSSTRYTWEVIAPTEVVPEPYALRGMPYLRKHAPSTPRKPAKVKAATLANSEAKPSTVTTTPLIARNAEMTPPQEHRVPDIDDRSDDETTPDATRPHDEERELDEVRLKQSPDDPTTPVLPHAARKQSTITDFMKSRKRSLKGTSSKSGSIVIEPPEKISRNAGQIRS
ncbi:cyclin-dependent kinase inhibitor 1 [Neodiprion pinetum]|uniref:Uncharacterized protein LOC107216851 n=1 Tax=Neodiprion lecontei TaxID=441921 RepID=A0A6J0B655_NEOLC|nr:uncharacterized protein LOC107216851 [Neodiprion lecontei]XP_046422500.1 uncharacterized protein LOC124180770 [Neodiprion fabricii]XP_046477100.1 uncharacterized protein LOC124216547 [Neodiprion pinetum]